MQERTTSFLIASSLAVLVASVAAAGAGWSTFELFCDAHEKALDTMGTVVLFAGLVLPLAIFLSRWRTKTLVSVLGLGAAIYAGAVVVLAVQGATYSQTCGNPFGLSSPDYTKSLNLAYLYVFWGGALLTLLVAIVAVLNEARGAGSGHTGVRSGPPTNRVPQH